MPRGSWVSYLRPQSGAKMLIALRLILGAVSGAGLSLSFAGLYLSFFSWVCIALLLFSVLGARPRVAFGSGFLHALLFVFTSVPWIATVLTVHGDLSVAGGWGVLLLIAMAWGVLIGTLTWAVERISRRGVTLACFAAPFLWVTFEFIRAHLPEISFPWNLLGYPASANLGLLQLTTITGIYGLSFLVAAFNALLAWAVASSSSLRKRFITVAITTAILMAVYVFGPRFVSQDQPHHFARAAQLNFPEVESYPADWFQQHSGELDEITRISLAPSAQNPDLLVWPEAPAPFSFQDQQFAKIASPLAIRFGHPFLAGVIEWKTPVDPSEVVRPGVLLPYNSALLLDSQGQRVFVYDKVHLVPFGEYEPFPLIHRVVSSVSSDVGGFHKGFKYVIGKLPGSGYPFGVFICYEAIYPGEVRRFAAGGAQLFINISNDGWFGRSAAAEQHLRMARVRAVENRRWIVRSTNNGFTVSIDPYGRIFRPLAPDIRAAVDLPYDFRTDETFYTRFGDWFAWLCVLVSVILMAATLRKATNGGTPAAAQTKA